MDRLMLWNETQIKDKISLCILKSGQENRYRERRGFPLSDVLRDFYRDAIMPEDFYTMENLELLYSEYKREVGEINFSIESLRCEGWILPMFNRWDSALKSESVWKDVDVKEEEYEDAETIRFMIWIKQKECGCSPKVRICNLEEKLEKWRRLYSDVPGLEWFEEQHFLLIEDGEYFAYRAYTCSEEIDRALAGLWKEWREEKPHYWLKAARALKGTDLVFKYLDEEEKKALFYFIQDEIFYKTEVPDWNQANKHYRKMRLLESAEYLKHPEEYDHVSLWCGNRVIDQEDFDRYGFEYYIRYYVHEHDIVMFLNPMLLHMEWGKDRDDISFCEQLEKYDEISGFYLFYSYDSTLLYEMITTKSTIYMGFRELLRHRNSTVLDKEEFDKKIIDIMAQVMDAGCKKLEFLSGREIGCCLFELMRIGKNSKWQENHLLWEMIDLAGKSNCIEIIYEELASYFRELLNLENAVHWISAYHLILLCVKRWFYSGKNSRKSKFFECFFEIVWEGYQIVFYGDGEYVKLLDASYFAPEICGDIYKYYINNNISSKRRLLLAREFTESDRNESIPYYYYRNLLRILFCILEQKENEDDIALRTIFTEAVENVLLSDVQSENGEELFNYAYMQIYSAEDIIARCIGMLSCEDSSVRHLMDNLLQKKVPELLIYYEAATDQRFKEQIRERIDKNATDDSLNVFHDERAIDIVLDNNIESLYSAAEKRLEEKLSVWKKSIRK